MSETSFPIPERARRVRALISCPTCGRIAVPVRERNSKGERVGPVVPTGRGTYQWECCVHGRF